MQEPTSNMPGNDEFGTSSQPDTSETAQLTEAEEEELPIEHYREFGKRVHGQFELPDLTAEQLNMVEVAFDLSKPQDEILASKFNLNITRTDIRTLSGLNLLNDSVINFYMNLINERAKNDKFPNAYAFNTFFYASLSKNGYTSIRRWTRKIDIFSYDVICVPIHKKNHWCMAIIDFLSEEVLYLDSLGKLNYPCTETLMKYLREEHQDKKKTEFIMKDWHARCVQDIPQQNNHSDCGVFSCLYAEYSSRFAEFTFTQDQMPYFRKKMAVEIISGRLLKS